MGHPDELAPVLLELPALLELLDEPPAPPAPPAPLELDTLPLEDELLDDRAPPVPPVPLELLDETSPLEDDVLDEPDELVLEPPNTPVVSPPQDANTIATSTTKPARMVPSSRDSERSFFLCTWSVCLDRRRLVRSLGFLERRSLGLDRRRWRHTRRLGLDGRH